MPHIAAMQPRLVVRCRTPATKVCSRHTNNLLGVLTMASRPVQGAGRTLCVWHADQHQPAAWASLACGSDGPSDITGVAFETGGCLADPDWLPKHGVGLAACSAMEVPRM